MFVYGVKLENPIIIFLPPNMLSVVMAHRQQYGPLPRYGDEDTLYLLKFCSIKPFNIDAKFDIKRFETEVRLHPILIHFLWTMEFAEEKNFSHYFSVNTVMNAINWLVSLNQTLAFNKFTYKQTRLSSLSSLVRSFIRI